MAEFKFILDQLSIWFKFVLAILFAYARTLIKRFKEDTDRLYQKNRDMKKELDDLKLRIEKHISYEEGKK
ncbi:MAG: hypothetical protein GY853_02290 [PVC group bacterium]|nr:hypothetical protein [PVC group bacterium]